MCVVCRYGINTSGCVTTQKSDVLVWCKVSYNEASEVRADVSDMQRTQESEFQTSVLKRCTSFSLALRPNAGQGLLINEVARSHTTTHHSR